MDASLLEPDDRDRVEMVLKYIEDGDLRRWSLPDIKAFNIGIGEWRSKLNCVTNPYMYEQVWNLNLNKAPTHPRNTFPFIFSSPCLVLKSLLTFLTSSLLQLLEINAVDVIAKGMSYISARQKAANKLLDKVFKIRLGRGFYGECLVNY